MNDATSFLASALRYPRGLTAVVTRSQRSRRVQPLQLFDFEACPYCRKVREILCALDLDYVCKPVAQGSPRRALLKRIGGKVQVPYLIDPNRQTAMYESEDIVAYLLKEYGADRLRQHGPPIPRLVNDGLSMLASVARFGGGSRCRVPNSRRRLKPLELFNMEGSPYCRKVRETLSELDLEYLVRNVPKGSPQRQELERIGGKVQVPFLIDPNTSTAMYESDEIVAYLEERYGAVPIETEK
ncbi:MAG: glutathione S-transferase N-terminal domain-containing protein [Candidatus Binatia bacterium]|nr:glutathione S-transferase N-terminal domain-containing protein [Candidatus Binatia bacterium]